MERFKFFDICDGLFKNMSENIDCQIFTKIKTTNVNELTADVVANDEGIKFCIRLEKLSVVTMRHFHFFAALVYGNKEALHNFPNRNVQSSFFRVFNNFC